MKTVEKVNILLVDDQPARLLTYEAILGELGQNLVRATTGHEALAQLMRADFAVVLLDVSMPDIDGFEAAKLIHEHPRFEKTPIIFATGVHISELDRLKGYKLGAVDYISVPVVPEILRSKVAVLVELHCKRRQLQELNRDLELANRCLQNEVRERARVELTLKERDRHKDEFLAMLAHELRNPLAPIHNAAQLLRRQPVVNPQLAWLVDIIERQLTQLTRLVDDLLDVSRITRGKINLAKEIVEVSTLVARAVETVQPLIEERRHRVSVQMPAETLGVLGDPIRLTQALANLLSNAAKYTECGGQITLSGQVQDGNIELRIRDTGIGIRAHQLPMIFELFTQLEGTSDRTQSGLGIGLALVRQLVEMHGGSIAAYSEGPGKGSEFVVRLPLYAHENTAATPALLHGQYVTAAPRTILVADDNADALASLAMLLELTGHRVYTASNGQQTLESAERERPEVILLDIGMPALDGYEVARRIRAQPWGKQITLVALTGWGQDSDRRLSSEAGFDAHLVKPVKLEDLTEVLAGRLPDVAAAEALEDS